MSQDNYDCLCYKVMYRFSSDFELYKFSFSCKDDAVDFAKKVRDVGGECKLLKIIVLSEEL